MAKITHRKKDRRQVKTRKYHPRLPANAASPMLSPEDRSTLDTPCRLVDSGTGLPSLTSLFADIRPITEEKSGITSLYLHLPSSALVEERFGQEAFQAFRRIIASFLSRLDKDMQQDRGRCVVARAFADDFIILIPHRAADGELSSSLSDSLARHLAAMDQEASALMEVYVGMAQSTPYMRIHPERLVYRLIQQAQAEATDVGRQRISFMVRHLDRCLKKESFTLHFQPIVRVEDHTIFGYEALVRCDLPDLKNPHVLFNVAEKGDRVQLLSSLLRRLAGIFMSDLPEQTCMFINLHPQDFDDPDLISDCSVLSTNSGQVVLEVTERAAIKDSENFRRTVAQLRELGFRIAVDDLGSGYSSLGLVAELNPDFIKLDMALIREIHNSPVRQKLVRNIVSFARDMDSVVVAEGVETQDELRIIEDLGCHLLQGYLLCRPGPGFVTKLPQV